MHLDEIARVIGHDRDPVAGHPITSNPVAIEVLRMHRRVDDLEPRDNLSPPRRGGRARQQLIATLLCRHGDIPSMRYLVVITEDLEDGGYNASCPALPGCHSEGATIEEAMDGIREAIACYLESLSIDDLPAPAPDPVVTEVEVA